MRAVTLWTVSLSLLLAACQPGAAPTDAKPAITATLRPAATITRPAPAPTLTPTAALPDVLQVQSSQLKGTRLTFWHPWGGEAARLMAELSDEFNRTNLWGVKVTVKAVGSSSRLDADVRSQMLSEDSPDVVAAPMHAVAAWQQINASAVVALDDYIESPEWGMKPAEVQDFTPLFWEQDTLEGRRMAVPAQRTLTLLFYNQSWGRELGFSAPPANADQLLEQACAAAKANNAAKIVEKYGTGGWIINLDPLTLMSWFTAQGGGASAGSAGIQFNTGKNRAVFTYLKDMADKGCAWSARQTTPYEYFANRLALFYSGTLEDAARQAETNARLKKSDEWIVLPYPGTGSARASMLDGVSYALLKSTPPRQMAAWLFIRWLSSADHQARLAQLTASLPVTTGARELSNAYAARSPQWQQALGYVNLAQPAPAWSTWELTGAVLQDAAWQIFNQNPAEPISVDDILKQLDETTASIEQRQK